MDLDVFTNGKVRSLQDIKAVDVLLEKVKHKDMWEVIGFIVQVFEKRYPEYSKSIQNANIDRRKRLIRGTASNKSHGMRHLISMPPQLKDLMDFFLEDYENPGFWREFARRFPQYKVPERI